MNQPTKPQSKVFSAVASQFQSKQSTVTDVFDSFYELLVYEAIENMIERF